SRNRSPGNELWRQDHCIPVLADVQVHQEIEEGALETSPGALEEDKTRGRHLHPPLDVENAEPLPDLVMGPRLEGRRVTLRRSPLAHRHVIAGILSSRDGLVRRIRDLEQEHVEARLGRSNALFQIFDMLALLYPLPDLRRPRSRGAARAQHSQLHPTPSAL